MLKGIRSNATRGPNASARRASTLMKICGIGGGGGQAGFDRRESAWVGQSRIHEQQVRPEATDRVHGCGMGACEREDFVTHLREGFAQHLAEGRLVLHKQDAQRLHR